MARAPEVHALCTLAPFCPAPDRVSHSHWMSHIPFAFWLTDILRPSIFVELGAYTGVSFCAFCQRIAELKLGCQAYAIDTWQGDANMGAYPEAVYEDLANYVAANYAGFASLIRSTFAAAAPQFEDGSIDLLNIDGCHTEEAMLADFELWLPKLSSRGVILMHDISARLPGYGGVAAWRKISANFPSFAFTHGYGLGLVLAGDNCPQALQDLCAMQPDEQALFANRFQQQGRIYEKLFWLEQKRSQEQHNAEAAASRAAAANSDLQAENTELRRLLEKERLERLTEREKMREEVTNAILAANALESSLSWKLTAPLRKMASLFRN